MLQSWMTAITVAMVAATPVLSHAQDERVLDVAAAFEITSPDPSISGSIFTKMSIAETLVGVDTLGGLEPELAIDWRVSDDGLIWTFSLRPDVTFHNGTAMTAKVVVAALEFAAAKPGLLEKIPLERFEAGQGEVMVHLSEPLAALPAFLAEYRSQILAPASYAADGTVTQVIGTGPYQIDNFAPPLALDAENFADYWGEAPGIDKVAYRAVGRAETRALLAESGDAEIVFGLDPASTTRLEGTDGLSIHKAPTPRSLLIKLNASHAFLDTPDARHALSLAIDRDGIATAVLRYPEGANQLFPPAVAGWHSEAVAPLGFDPAKASAMLEALGWQAGSDGILARDGERFALELLTYPDRPELPLVAAVLEQQLKAVGIEVMINSTSFSEIPSGHQDGSLELALFARNFALVPDPIGTVLEDYAPGGDWGAMGWQNDDFIELVRQMAAGERGPEGRGEAAAMLQADLPVIPIAWYQIAAAVSDGIEGAVIDPWEQTFGLTTLRWKD